MNPLEHAQRSLSHHPVSGATFMGVPFRNFTIEELGKIVHIDMTYSDSCGPYPNPKFTVKELTAMVNKGTRKYFSPAKLATACVKPAPLLKWGDKVVDCHGRRGVVLRPGKVHLQFLEQTIAAHDCDHWQLEPKVKS